jgi:hypothetical protein
MKHHSALTGTILLALVLALVIPATAARKRKKPQAWPDLSNIDVGIAHPCNIDGNGQHGQEKGKLNDLKNRFRLPTGNFQTITFNELLAMNQGHIVGDTIQGFPTSSDQGNQKAVVLEGYVNRVSVGGCSTGESCNCGTQVKKFCDTHIDFFPDKDSVTADGHNMFVVEITQRMRLLAAQGFLTSNVGNDWSTDTLKPLLEGHRVRFSGWLYFDTDHVNETWQPDPHDTVKKVNPTTGKVTWGNWRQTAWEIHPVMKIAVLP